MSVRRHDSRDVVAERILPPDISIVACTLSIGDIVARNIPGDLTRMLVDAHQTRCPDPVAAEHMEKQILACRDSGDSLGGTIELRIEGAPAGLGEPVFRKAKSLFAGAFMGIGGVTGVMLGDAFNDTALSGRIYHAVSKDVDRPLRASGIQGGITNSDRITVRLAVKPPSTLGSIAKLGRHDPCIVPRVIPVVEAMAALVMADLILARKLNTI